MTIEVLSILNLPLTHGETIQTDNLHFPCNSREHVTWIGVASFDT